MWQIWHLVRKTSVHKSSAVGMARVLIFLLVQMLPVSSICGRGQPIEPPQFDNYRVPNVYKGKVKPPNIGNLDQYGGTDLRCFAGEPSEFAKEQVNFAGHFVLGTCTCGSGCHYLFMWDAVTGKFYPRLPPGVIDVGPYEGRDVQPPGIGYKGEEYKLGSNLLIVEGCVEDTCDCATRYYRWTGRRFKLVLRQPVPMPARCLKKPSTETSSPDNK